MVIEDFPDRVQVTIEHSGESKPTAGLDTFVGVGSKDHDGGKISASLQIRELTECNTILTKGVRE
jgi:hypothetical protein